MGQIQPGYIDAVANVAGVLFTADNTRNGILVQNLLSSPIYISPDSPPLSGPPSYFVPAATAQGPGYWESPPNSFPQQGWNYITAATGRVTKGWW